MTRTTRTRAGALGGLLAMVLALTGMATVPAAAAPSTQLVAGPQLQTGVLTDAAQFEDRILELLNRDRAAKGMNRLQRVRELDTVARSWSTRMAREGSMYHNPSYSSQYPSGWRRAAENVAMGYPTPDEMYRGWYNSPGHYRNMFNPELTHIGIGIAYGTASWGTAPYGTQNFATYPSGTRLTPTSGASRPTTPGAGSTPAPTGGVDDGGIGGTGNTFHLNNAFGGAADVVFRYGETDSRTYVGDWDGDGQDTLAYRVGNTFYVRNANSAGPAHHIIPYGRADDRVYVGDWDGDGKDTFAVRRDSVYHVKNSMSGGAADEVIAYGRPGDDVLVGDWDGDRRDTFAVRRDNAYYIKNAISGGNADHVITYGRSDDDVYVGDWDGDRRDTLAVRRGKTYYLKNVIRGGNADIVVGYGRDSDTTLVGDWNGTGRDTLGIRR